MHIQNHGIIAKKLRKAYPEAHVVAPVQPVPPPKEKMSKF